METIQESVKAAQESVRVGTHYLSEVQAVYHFLQVNNDLADAKQFLNAATRLASELPQVVAAIDQIDNAMDAYARNFRKTRHQHIESKDLDPGILKDLTRRALPLLGKISHLSGLADDVPNDFEIEEYSDSHRIQAINELASRMSDLQTDMTFDASELEYPLEHIKDTLLDYINRGPE